MDSIKSALTAVILLLSLNTKLLAQKTPVNMDSAMNMMTSDFSLNLPMARDGSGTSWLPDASPMHGLMFSSGSWNFMAHYNLFLRYDNQDVFRKGSRGGAKFDAPNMGMLLGQHKVGRNGLFHFEVMLSLDPITVQGYGYPLLFQTGESWRGKPLIDRQHPHDLFSEASASYSQALSKNSDLSLYVGYPGEPALGPVTFMHRPSGMDGPDAPIGHHWQDATHITFGVATLGFRLYSFKLEGSSFTGREPNENRFNFDKPRFDSYSGRLSYNALKNWALQLSRGFIKSPEELRPAENVTRTTASANYARELSSGTFLTGNLVWGLNQMKGQAGSNSVGFEGALELHSTSLYARYEWVKKSAEELELFSGYLTRFPSTSSPTSIYGINTFTLGLNQIILSVGQTNVALGAQATLNITPTSLEYLYGKSPVSGEVFIRIFPGLMKMHKSGVKMDNTMSM